MRLLLKGRQAANQEPSSKSFKATVLSWAAKRGVDGLSIQRLGYHASGGLDIVYSRVEGHGSDSLAPNLVDLEASGGEDEGSFGSSTTSADEDDHQPVAAVARGKPIPEGFDLWLHASSKVAHLAVLLQQRTSETFWRAGGP